MTHINKPMMVPVTMTTTITTIKIMMKFHNNNYISPNTSGTITTARNRDCDTTTDPVIIEVKVNEEEPVLSDLLTWVWLLMQY